MNWQSDELLEIGDVRYDLVIALDDLHRMQSSENRFVLGKTRMMVETIKALGEEPGADKIFEIGIFKGGSTVLYDQLFEPSRLVAVDLSRDEVPALSSYLRANGRESAVQLHFGVDQSDTARLLEILGEAFPARSLDLVVDDASHSYAGTKASFNAAFPFLRYGGAYVIEDWAWAHWPGDDWQKDGGIWRDQPALSNLAVELVMASASSSHLIKQVHVSATMLIIERGYADVTPGELDISSLYLTRGRPFTLQL